MRFFVLILLSFFLVNNTSGQILITDNTDRSLIGKELYQLHTKDELKFDQVFNNADFQKLTNEIPNLGLSPNSIWLKFTVTNNSFRPDYLLNISYPILDEVELFAPDSTNKYSSILLGEINKYTARPYDHPNYIFDLNVAPGNSKTYFLRIKSAEQVIVPITINRPTDLWVHLSQEDLITGIYLGVILIMIFYNLFLFFSVRDKSYLFYVFYVLFAGLTQIGIKGYTFKYLWPDNPSFELKSIILFACLSCIAAILFTKKFLVTKQTAKKSDIILSFLIVLFLAGILATFSGKVQLGFQIMLQTTSLFSIIILVVSFIIMIQGFKPAKYFFAAWSVLLVGSIIFILKDYGILPYNTITSYSVQAASALEMALLSFGLANSINILKKEKEISQMQALNAAQENERIIKEQNIMLEEKVAERTEELMETNDNLNTTLDDLKQAQSQLVESEKMASLGQLTAGIAHEINNPINFVTSNVAPLKRDVGMVFDTIDFIEEIGFSEMSVAEKKQKISDFKEELDYDYLKIEINHLLNGIYEGSSRTAEIVKGLRIFSRVDENDLKRADINEGIDSTLIIVNNLLNSSIEIKKEYANPMPAIECYPGKLNQVFLNIITNAIHAIRKKHGDNSTGIITIRTKAFEDHITVEFLDNGIGMDEATMHKIYEPFFTTKEVGEGTGLGMSIVYNTIKKHNGSIKLVSKVGEGTSFIFHLPIIFELQTIAI